MIRTRFAAVLIAAPLALAGCSGAQTPADQAASTPSATQATQTAGTTPTPGQNVDAQQFMADTQKATLDAKTYHMIIQQTEEGRTKTITGAFDVTNPQRARADASMTLPGDGQQSRMIIDGDSIYLLMPDTSGSNKFVRMPVQSLSQAGGVDINKLLNPAENLKMSQAAIEKVTFDGQDAGLNKYTVTMDLGKVQDSLVTTGPSPSVAPAKTNYNVWLDDAHRVRKMIMNVAGTMITMSADKYGEPVTIVAPPQESVTQMPGMSTTEPGTATPVPAPTASASATK